jgi:hypothetical protein
MAFMFKWMQNNFILFIYFFYKDMSILSWIWKKNLNKKYSLVINNSYQLISKVKKLLRIYCLFAKIKLIFEFKSFIL